MRINFRRSKGRRLECLLAIADRVVVEDPPRYPQFAIIGLLFCFLPVLLLMAAGNAMVNKISMELCLRAFAVIVCVVLCFQEMWPKRIRKKYSSSCWFFLLSWCLPMLGTYGMILRHNDWVWIMHGIMSIIMLSAFASRGAFFLLLLVGSCVGGLLASFNLSLGYDWIMVLPIADTLSTTVVLMVYLILASCLAEEIMSRIKDTFSLSAVDKLTGLNSRRYMEARFSGMVKNAAKSGSPLSLLMLDMDKFGEVNKIYGHQSGDMVLQQLGRLLQINVWRGDLCVRYGGEEFLIALRDTDLNGAIIVANRLCKLVEERIFAIAKEPYKIKKTVSIGIATLQPNENAASFIARADANMRAAKQNGRNQVVYVTTNSALTSADIKEVHPLKEAEFGSS